MTSRAPSPNNKPASRDAGFSLVEVLAAMFVLALGVAGALRFFVAAANSSRYAGELTAAYTHLEYVLEEMRTRPGLSQINAADWDGWADAANFKTLPEEAFSVSYPGGAAGNPLAVELTVNWRRGGFIQSAGISTQITE